MPTTAAVAAVAGAATAAYGAYSSGQASSAAAKYNSQTAANNAAIATQNARFAAEEGEVNVANEQQKTRAELGGILANQGASGVDVNSGSAVDVRSSAAETGELNAINIRANAARQAYGYETQAASDMGQSALDKSQAGNDTTAGYIGAGSTLLTGAGQAGSTYQNYQMNNSIANTSYDPATGITWNK